MTDDYYVFGGMCYCVMVTIVNLKIGLHIRFVCRDRTRTVPRHCERNRLRLSSAAAATITIFTATHRGILWLTHDAASCAQCLECAHGVPSVW